MMIKNYRWQFYVALTSCSGKESTRIEGPVQRPEGPAGPALLLSPEDPGTKDFLKGLVIPWGRTATVNQRINEKENTAQLHDLNSLL